MVSVVAAWPTVALDELCDLVKGTSPTMKTVAGPFPLVVTAEHRRTADTYQLEGPAVCVPLISSTGHGHASLHRVHYQEGRFALATLLVALLPKDPMRCDARYLYHLLMAKKDEYFVPLMQGTANVSLKERDIAGVQIPLPPLDEQRRIVARIEALVACIAEARVLRQATVDDMRQLLLGQYANISAGAPLMRMAEVAPLVRRPIAIDSTAAYPELGIRSFGKGTFHKPLLPGTLVGTKKLFSIEPGDLLFNIVFAWEGAVAVAQPTDAGRVGSHRFLTCVPKTDLATASYLRFHFLTEDGLRQLGEASPGGAGRNRTLGLKALDNIRVPVPHLEKQLWFEALLSTAENLGSAQAEADAEIDALLPSARNQAFRGEL